MRDAISLLDQLTAYGSDTITLAQVQAVLGVAASESVTELADDLIDGDLAHGLEVIDRVVGDGAEPRQFTREFVEYLRSLLLLKMGDGAGLLRASVPDETLARMQEQSARVSPRMLLRATRLFNAAALEMKLGFLPQLPLELAFVEAVMDEAVERILKVVFKAEESLAKGHTCDLDANHQLARRVAGEAAVLLKNDGTMLPLAENTKVAVIGRFAKEPRYQGAGSSLMNPTRLDNLYDEMVKLVGEDNLSYAPGYDATGDTVDHRSAGAAIDWDD